MMMMITIPISSRLLGKWWRHCISSKYWHFDFLEAFLTSNIFLALKMSMILFEKKTLPNLPRNLLLHHLRRPLQSLPRNKMMLRLKCQKRQQ